MFAALKSDKSGKKYLHVEDQRPDIQMKRITKYPGFQSTRLDAWVHETANLFITHSDSSMAQTITPKTSMFSFI